MHGFKTIVQSYCRPLVLKLWYAYHRWYQRGSEVVPYDVKHFKNLELKNACRCIANWRNQSHRYNEARVIMYTRICMMLLDLSCDTHWSFRPNIKKLCSNKQA